MEMKQGISLLTSSKISPKTSGEGGEVVIELKYERRAESSHPGKDSGKCAAGMGEQLVQRPWGMKSVCFRNIQTNTAR